MSWIRAPAPIFRNRPFLPIPFLKTSTSKFHSLCPQRLAQSPVAYDASQGKKPLPPSEPPQPTRKGLISRGTKIYGSKPYRRQYVEMIRPFEPKPKRALFYVPGSSQKMIDKAWTLDVDNITLDLEDSVLGSEKTEALNLVVEALKTKPRHPTAEVGVRINTSETGHLEEELRKLATVDHAIDAIVLPKFTKHHFRGLASNMSHFFSAKDNYKIYGLIETPLCLETLSSALVSHFKRNAFKAHLTGLIFGAEDYAKAAGITRSTSLTEMTYARQRIVAIAKAFNLQCIDLVSTNFRDMESLRAECEQGSSFGFTGKQAIHPSQIPIIQETFTPAKDNVNYAIRLLSQYVKEARDGKRGAWEFEGEMIDRPVIRKAKRTVSLAHTYGIEKAAAESVLEQLSGIGENYESNEIDSLRKYL